MIPLSIPYFRGPYSFLSNFYLSEMEVNGIVFPALENAYQSLKTTDESAWPVFAKVSPSVAKQMGRKIPLRPDWEEVKLDAMYQLVAIKFAVGTELAQKLLDTADRELIEGNTWNDRFWGICNGKGENWLGRILMHWRSELRRLSA